MIQQLEGHITENQINEIVRIIIDQYKKYCRLINCAQFLDIFSEEYAPTKRIIASLGLYQVHFQVKVLLLKIYKLSG